MREHVQCEAWHRGGRNIDRWWRCYCSSGVIDAELVKIVAVLPIDCWMMMKVGVVGEMIEKKSDGGDGGKSI